MNNLLNAKLIALSLVLPAVAVQSAEAKKKAKNDKPNVILIMADDLGWGDTGFNGSTMIKTPNLDQMAEDGIRFDRFYAACAVSSPTRASVLTGRNPFRTGIFTANMGVMRPEEVTIPELLNSEGYVSGHFGKWHVGSLTHTERDANRGKEGNTKDYNPPKVHGYETAFVSESKVPTWDPMLSPAKPATKGGWDYIKEGEPTKPFGTHYWDIDGVKQTENLSGDDSRVIMDRVLPFIDEQVGADKNFCAVVWFHAPHMPCVAGPEYAEMYKDLDQQLKNYAGCITAMDDQIGRLRAHLAELGVDENTMIWFCSDNGPENNGGGTTGGYKERKRSLHEGGVRVPGVMVWPAVVKGGRDVAFPATTTDYLPTIAAAAGVDPKLMTNELDGINLMPLLEDKVSEREEPIVLCFRGQVSISDNDSKVYVKNGNYEYYDIVEDGFEENPVAVPADKQVLIEKMKARIERYKASFEGEEYGTAPLEISGQKWEDPFKIASKK